MVSLLGCLIEDCDRPHGSKGYCKLHYNRLVRHGDPLTARRMVPRGSSLVERMDLLSDRSSGFYGCWNWVGTIHYNGYGMLQFEGKTRQAHVWAYVLLNGEPPEDKPFVLHSCDNRMCVNPHHLRAGTLQDNMDDKVSRNRQSHAIGELGYHKLTESQVLEIRDKRHIPTKVVALEYGISLSNVHLIWNRQRWSHLPERGVDVN